MQHCYLIWRSGILTLLIGYYFPLIYGLYGDTYIDSLTNYIRTSDSGFTGKKEKANSADLLDFVP